MWHQHLRKNQDKTGRRFRHSRLADKSFQKRLTLIISSGAALGLLCAMVPTLYFINENYRIFADLAYQQAPNLLNDLERERVWLHILFASIFIGTTCYFGVLVWRVTSRVAIPLKVMKSHLRELCRGNWRQTNIRVRSHDEFQDLIESYNYFFNSFRQNVKRDLEFLRKLSLDKRNRDAYLAWRNLMKEKSLQLGLNWVEPTLNHPAHDGADEPSHDSRRVS